MRYQIEAATDTGALILFDPAAITPALGRHGMDGAAENLERMDRAGSACWIRTGSDGRFLIHLYVDEPIPERLRALADDPREFDAFPVPSGKLCLTGPEDALLESNPETSRRQQLNSSATVAPGNYRLRIYRVEYPRGSLQEAFRAQAPATEYLAWISMKFLIPLAIAAWIGLVVIFFTTVRVPLPHWAAAVLGIVFSLPFLVRRLEAFTAARARYQDLEREQPSIVVELNPTGPMGLPKAR